MRTMGTCALTVLGLSFLSHEVVSALQSVTILLFLVLTTLLGTRYYHHHLTLVERVLWLSN